MPAAIDEIIKRRVIEQWINGFPRDRIASDLQIGSGTVSNIVSEFKNNLQGSDIDSVRELAAEARKQGFTLNDLAVRMRLNNFFDKSGAAEDQIESFIVNLGSSGLPPDKVIELVNQLYDVSKMESVALDQIPSYIEQKFEEKHRIDNEIKQADDILEGKNVTIEVISEHLKLKEELERHGVSIQDIDKLLKILVNAGRYGFDGKEFADKLYNMLELEWKERELKDKCKKFSKRISKYKDILPLSEAIAAWGIGIDQLLALKVGINQAAKYYNLPPLAATLRLIEDIKKYNKINGLREELSALYLQKYTIEQAYSRKSQPLIALATLKSYGLSEDRILQLSNFLEDNVFKVSGYASKR